MTELDQTCTADVRTPRGSVSRGALFASLRSRARLFRRDEEGSIIVFSLFLFIMMLLIGGMAVDLMRFETRRTALQNTIDSAVLAAANLNQNADPDTLVRDFFDKSGYDGSKVVVNFTEDRIGDVNGVGGELVGRTVTASLDLEVGTIFMGMLGIEELSTMTSGRAAENVQNVEISLIVDISGSMDGSRMTALKSAAKDFFRDVIDPDRTEGITSISIVPYNANVVVPDWLLDALNTSGIGIVDTPEPFPGALTAYPRTASGSKCVQFSDDQMMTTNLAADYEELRAISPTTVLDRLQYFDEGSQSGPGGDYDRPVDDWNRFCDPTRTPIAVHETDIGRLDAVIDGLQADGWTAIDNGMKWGVALLDPAMRPVINQAIDDGHLTEAVRNRPGDYIGTETMKVVVLMTDGANTVTRDVRDQYKNGPSRVWFSQQAADATGDWWDGFFIQLPENPDSRYWWQGQEPWDRYDGAYWHRDSLPADAVQWHYTQLYDRFSEFALADLFRDHRYMDDDVLDTLRSQHRSAVYEPNSYGDLDERLNGNGTDTTPDTVFGICDAARRDNDILVFTIAFEAPDGGETQMRRCATANGFYFDAANATALEEAFSAIAGQITKLRLTQ